MTLREILSRLRGPWIADDPNPEPSWLDRRDNLICVCSHPAEAHKHLRPGSDCGFCGRYCPQFQPDIYQGE